MCVKVNGAQGDIGEVEAGADIVTVSASGSIASMSAGGRLGTVARRLRDDFTGSAHAGVDIGRLVALSTLSTTVRAERDIGTAQAGVWTTDFFGGVRVDPDADRGRIDAHLWAQVHYMKVATKPYAGGKMGFLVTHFKTE